MATCLDVITTALKLGRIIPAGEQPEADEAADGMVCLQSLYDHWRIGGMFGSLVDTYLTGDDTAKEGKRYFIPVGMTLADATSIYTDDCGNTRQPRDLALYETLSEAGEHAAKLYDRTAWVDLLGLKVTDEAPLASRGLVGLAACLATSGAFAAMFGDTATMNPDVRGNARDFLRDLSSKAGSTQDNAGADYF